MTSSNCQHNDSSARSRPARRGCRRQGYTLLELIMTSGLMAVVLVPTLQAMRQGVELGRKIESREMVNALCISKLEEQLALAAATFTETTTSGDFAGDAYATLRWQAFRSTDPGDGGIEDRLMAITVVVWDDEDGSGSPGANEPQATFATKVAKMALYQQAAGGS